MKRLLISLFATFIATITYSQPGTVDKTFGDNGFVTTKTLSGIRASAIQRDGKLLAAGGYNDPDGNIARFLPNGTLDSSFGNSGFAYGGGAYDMILQPDEKILIVGLTLNENGKQQYFVARYQPNGTLDSSFGKNGTTLIPNFNDFSGYSHIGIEPDGSIIISGAGTPYSEAVALDYMILSRLTADGTFEYNFGEEGRVLQKVPTYYTVGEGALTIQKDGKILLGGFGERGGYQYKDFALIRFNMNGTLDEQFGESGIVTTQGINGEDVTKGIIVQPDGKIVVGGYSSGNNNLYYMAALRYNTDGTLDESFGEEGKSFVSFKGKMPYVNDIIMQPDGKFVLAGVASDIVTRYYDFAMCRLNANGSIDSSFAVDGRQLTAYKNAATAYCATVQQDGKIVLGGNHYDINKGPSYLLIRYNGDKAQPSIIAKIKRWLHNHGISWQGLDNKNISYYSIQYSKWGKGFAEKGKLSGAGSSRLQDYNFTVADAGFYRIVAVDRKGYKTFSNKVLVSAGDLASTASIYTNPVRDYVTVQGLQQNEPANISIANSSGTVLATGVSNGSTQFRAPAASLQPGTYYLHITTANKTETLKFVKE